MVNQKLSPLQELLRKKLAEKVSTSNIIPVQEFPVTVINQEKVETPAPTQITELILHKPKPVEIVYNAEQQRFIDIATSRRSVALTGAAGTGKTTVVKGAVLSLLAAGKLGVLKDTGHKYLRAGTPGIVFCSFTNKAVSNLKKHLPADLRENCLSIHKLLEFEPVEDIAIDEKTGESKTIWGFKPKRTATYPLDSSITTIVLEESSMIGVPLWNQLADALITKNLQVILIGDLQQLPPVFGKSIFIHAFQQGIETVELTQVYRQALESPIIALATRIISGKQIPQTQFPEYAKKTEQGIVVIQPWKKQLSDVAALKIMSMWLPEQIDKGTYNPEEDIILTPYNKAFGTIALNEIIASHIAAKRGAEVHEIFAGIKRLYFRVGERVLYNKTEAVITKIEPNKKYFGKFPRPPSKTLTYTGIETNPAGLNTNLNEQDFLDIERRLELAAAGSEEKSSRQASAIVTVYIPDLDKTVPLATAGEVGALDLGYAITVHKSQGSEYKKVFFITHKSQNTMLSRELVYTAITRARQELIVICEPNLFVQGINSQRLQGNNVAEKVANFERSMEISKCSDSELPNKTHVFKYDGIAK